MSEAVGYREAPAGDFCVIGDPVAHSRSPHMHAAAYRALGLELTYRAIHVPEGKVSEALGHLRDLGYQGVNVTVPHKEAALAWATSASEDALRARAANTLRLSDGAAINTDLPGFADTLAPFAFSVRRALVLGAGGSARSVLWALRGAGFEVALWNRTVARAEALAREIPDVQVQTEPHPDGHDLIVNATSASLGAVSLGVDWSRAAQEALAYDLAYAAGPTVFLQEAASAGRKGLDGRELLVAQGARAFEWWLGKAPPRDVMREAIR